MKTVNHVSAHPSTMCPVHTLRQKKVSKVHVVGIRSLREAKLREYQKATLVAASLRFAAGNLRCSVQAGSR